MWIFYVLIAVLFWAAVNILDKYIIGHELKDPYLVTTVFGLTTYTLFVFIALANGSVGVPVVVAIMAMLAGFSYCLAVIFYYKSMQGMEVSHLALIMATGPLFVAVASFFIFQEKLSFINYTGIVLIMAGAMIISHKKMVKKKNDKKRKSVSKFIYIIPFVLVGLMSCRNLLMEYVSSEVGFMPMIFWMGLGGLIVPLSLLIFHHPHLKKKAEKGVIHLCVSGILSALALIAFARALTEGSVTLSTALLSTKPMIVFLAATFLSFFHPNIILEKQSKKLLVKKIVAMFIIVAGGIF